LQRGYSPMAVRFFMLQAHYRSTLDFSNEALDAADRGYKRLMNAMGLLAKLKATAKKSDIGLEALMNRCYAAMNDDFNSPILIAELFEGVRIINSVYDGKLAIDASSLEALNNLMRQFVYDVLGLVDDYTGSDDFDKLMEVVIALRNEAKQNKDYTTSDRIREGLSSIGIQLKDSKEGTLWNKI